LLALQSFKLSIAWFTDNQNVVSIVSIGSKKPELHDMSLQLFKVCLNSQINLDIKWVPREAISDADSISQFLDYDDYTIIDTVFMQLDALWGPRTCTVDRFACFYNAKVQRFNSRFYQIGTEAVDSFTQNWVFKTIGFFLQQYRLYGSFGIYVPVQDTER
jgi:hypothetical protein